MTTFVGLMVLLGLLSLFCRESAEDKAKREDKERAIKYMQEASWFYDEFHPASYSAPSYAPKKLLPHDLYYSDHVKAFRKEYKDLCLRALAVDENDYAALDEIRDAVIARYYS